MPSVGLVWLLLKYAGFVSVALVLVAIIFTASS